MRITLMVATIGLVSGCGQLAETQVPDPPRPQAPAVVFDIDGTLTPDVAAFSEARPDAANAVRRYTDNGYRVIYLSTRISLLQRGVPAWLKEKGFPESSIHVAQTDADHDDPASFKTRIMKEYQKRGWQLIGGYGDSATDFEAYANAGIPKSSLFALQRRSESSCQPGQWQECLLGWTEHLGYIAQRHD